MQEEEQMNEKAQKSSYLRDVVKRFFHHKLAVLGLVVIVLEILAVIILPPVMHLDPYGMDVMNFSTGPSAKHLLGTDDVGRDLFARLVYGGQISLMVGICSALIGLAGAFYVSSAGTLSTSVTNDVGWTGIVVAWLAKLNTVGILLTSLLITVLQFGCQAASTAYPTIDANFADLLQGVILFVVLAADFFIRFKVVRGGRGKEVAGS